MCTARGGRASPNPTKLGPCSERRNIPPPRTVLLLATQPLPHLVVLRVPFLPRQYVTYNRIRTRIRHHHPHHDEHHRHPDQAAERSSGIPSQPQVSHELHTHRTIANGRGTRPGSRCYSRDHFRPSLPGQAARRCAWAPFPILARLPANTSAPVSQPRTT